MSDRKSIIVEFFDHYAFIFNQALTGGKVDIDGVVNSFAENFIAANPYGVTSGKNDYSFRTAIPKGWEFYKSIGVVRMNILSSEISLLDDFHALARIRWQSIYQTKDRKEGTIEFDVIYVLQMRPLGIKIFAYITGDEQKAFKEAGLIPA